MKSTFQLGFTAVFVLAHCWATRADSDLPSSRPAPAAARLVASEKPTESAAIAQARYTRRIRAIRESLIDSSIERLRQRGREQILAIADPLAIDPLARELSRGGVHARTVLLRAMQRFPHTEATLNIAALALADPDESIAAQARQELKLRADPTIVSHLKQALLLNDDMIVGRAATALAALDAREAIPFMIPALTAQKARLVQVTVPRFGVAWENCVGLGCPPIATYPAFIETTFGESVVGSLRSQWAVRDVTVMRTQVLEAMKSLTGQNFGFDAEAWAHWYNSRSRTAEDR